MYAKYYLLLEKKSVYDYMYNVYILGTDMSVRQMPLLVTIL